MLPSTLILIRHGHVEGITPERFRGRSDLPLTALGIEQSQLTASFVASQWSATAIYSSPLGRCINTAKAIAEQQHLSVQVLEQLMDIDYGNWQGRVQNEVQSHDTELFELWMKQPQLAVIEDGETLSDVQARVVRAFDQIRKANDGGTIIVVGHDSVIRIFLTLALGLPLSAYWQFKQGPCAVNVLHFVEEGCRVECINATAHLTGVLRTSYSKLL
jgi:probable phosphoglycerate mutase